MYKCLYFFYFETPTYQDRRPQKPPPQVTGTLANSVLKTAPRPPIDASHGWFSLRALPNGGPIFSCVLVVFPNYCYLI